MDPEEIRELISDYIEKNQSDLYVFSGGIDVDAADKFVDTVCSHESPMPAASVFLTTFGGDAHAAYRIAKCLQDTYQRIRLLIAGPCKSAGTLVALGVNELAFDRTGELGPLDVQLAKPDEILPNSSGLDIFQALAIVTSSAFSTFESYLVQLTSKSGGNISTKTAAEIATKMVSGIFEPVAAQIDPLRLGEAQRAINIAKAYGQRLGLKNLKQDALDKIVETYPSHAFVIDMQEAKNLFERVERFSEAEKEIAGAISRLVRYPTSTATTFDLGKIFADPTDDEEENEQAGPESNPGNGEQNPSQDGSGEPGHIVQDPNSSDDGGTCGKGDA